MVNNMLLAFEKERALQSRAATRHRAATSDAGLDTILASHPERVYPDHAPEWTQERDRPGSRIVSRLSPECQAYAGAIETDTDKAVKLNQFARISGVKANGTDYVKTVTARGCGEKETVVKGPMMDVRFTARWRNDYDSAKAAAACIIREDKAMRFHFPYLLCDGEWRKPRTLKDGRIVYGRDKVGADVLVERYAAAQAAESDRVDADARRVREIELAELIRLQNQDLIAQGRGKVAPSDKCDTAMSQAFAQAGI